MVMCALVIKMLLLDLEYGSSIPVSVAFFLTSVHNLKFSLHLIWTKQFSKLSAISIEDFMSNLGFFNIDIHLLRISCCIIRDHRNFKTINFLSKWISQSPCIHTSTVILAYISSKATHTLLNWFLMELWHQCNSPILYPTRV